MLEDDNSLDSIRFFDDKNLLLHRDELQREFDFFSRTGQWYYNYKKSKFMLSDEAARIIESDIEIGPLAAIGFISKAERYIVVKRLISSIRDRIGFDITFTTIPFNGKTKFLRIRGKYLRRDKHAIIGTVEDITISKMNEENLKETIFIYENLFSNLSEMFIHLGYSFNKEKSCFDFDIKLTNNRFNSFFKIDRHDVRGKSLSTIFDSANSAMIITLDDIVKSKKPKTFEIYISNRDTYLEIRAYFPLPEQIALIISDITDKKRTELSLLKTLRYERSINQIISLMKQNTTTHNINFVISEIAMNMKLDKIVLLENNGDNIFTLSSSNFEFPRNFSIKILMEDFETLIVNKDMKFYAYNNMLKTANNNLNHLLKTYFDDRECYVCCSSNKNPTHIFLATRSKKKDQFDKSDIYYLSTIVGIISDRIVAAKADREREESANQLRNLLEEMPIMLCATDKQGQIILWNSECERITGYPRSKMIGEPLFSNIVYPHESYRNEILQIFCHFNKNFRNLEWDLIASDGSEKSISWFSIAESCSVPGWDFWMMGVDFSEKKEAIVALRESEQLSKGLLNAIPDLLFILSDKGIVKYCQSKSESLFQGFSSEVVNRSAQEIMSEQNYQKTMDALFQTISTKRVQNIFYNIENGGTESHYKARMVPFSKNEVLTIVNNVTAQKALEEELKQAEKMAAIGQLAGGIAHDFNNQLMGILNYADLLKRNFSKEFSTDKVYYLDQIKIAVNRSSDLIKQLLAFSRKGRYSSQVTNISNIVKETIPLLSTSIDKKIDIIEYNDIENPFFIGDASQMQNLILNLCLNSRDAMSNGGQLIINIQNIFLTKESKGLLIKDFQPGEFIQIEIKDFGSGIKKELLPHIFEPFFTTKKQGEGTGLGLAAVFGTITGHKGTLKVTSKEGKGTVFNIYIPTTNERPIEKAKTNLSPILTKKVDKSYSVMIVDDEEIVLDVLTGILEDEGFTVWSFSSGISALNFFKKNSKKIDLMLLDMIMPQMNGKDLLKSLRKIDNNPGCMIISGYMFDKESDELNNMGVDSIIAKPIEREALLRKIYEKLHNDNGKNIELYTIDKQEALSRLDGNEEIYLKILNNFIRHYSNASVKVSELNNLSNSEAVHYLHSLKNQVAAIGGSNLSKKISEIEKDTLENGKVELRNISLDLTEFIKKVVSEKDKISIIINN